MTTCHVKKISLIESRQNSTPSATLNTTDMSLNNTNLESYKKALHNIVRRLNKTPSVTNKAQMRRSEVRFNQSQQFAYTPTNASSSTNKKQHYMGSYGPTRTQTTPKRSLSNEFGQYRTNKDVLNKSLNEQPHVRKDSVLYTSISKSTSTNKYEKNENYETENSNQDKLLKNESKYGIDEGSLSTYVLQETGNNSPRDKDSEKRLRELVNKYQSRDAVHRQEILKLKKANETLKTQVEKLEKDVEKMNKTKEIEKKYTAKLEAELNQLREKMKVSSIDKKGASTASSDKENRYVKTIEELKSQVTSMSSEKKMMEHLLKNALQQQEVNKDASKIEKNYSSHILNGLETSFGDKSSKYSGIPRANSRVKTDNFVKKTLDTEAYNDENDYALHAQYPPQNVVFGGMPNNGQSKTDKADIEYKEASFNLDLKNLNKFLNEGTSVMDSACSHDEPEEIFPDKVVNPRLVSKSLKERIDMNKFKLDFTRIMKSRKVE